jgi:hypothetical protein
VYGIGGAKTISATWPSSIRDTDADADAVVAEMAKPDAWIAASSAGPSNCRDEAESYLAWSSTDIGCGVPTAASAPATNVISSDQINRAVAGLTKLRANPKATTCPLGGAELFADSPGGKTSPFTATLSVGTHNFTDVYCSDAEGLSTVRADSNATYTPSITKYFQVNVGYDYQYGAPDKQANPSVVSQEFDLDGGRAESFCYTTVGMCELAWVSNNLSVTFNYAELKPTGTPQERLLLVAKWGAAHLTSVVTSLSQS